MSKAVERPVCPSRAGGGSARWCPRASRSPRTCASSSAACGTSPGGGRACRGTRPGPPAPRRRRRQVDRVERDAGEVVTIRWRSMAVPLRDCARVTPRDVRPSRTAPDKAAGPPRGRSAGPADLRTGGAGVARGLAAGAGVLRRAARSGRAPAPLGDLARAPRAPSLPPAARATTAARRVVNARFTARAPLAVLQRAQRLRRARGGDLERPPRRPHDGALGRPQLRRLLHGREAAWSSTSARAERHRRVGRPAARCRSAPARG